MRVSVGIVDDHPAIIHGVTAMLNMQHDLFVVGAAPTVAELLRLSPRFDVVLLDLLLADGSTPTENLRALAEADANVVVYSSGDQPALVREASRAGGYGMIRKSAAASELYEAIRAAACGEVAASADWAAALDVDTSFVRTLLSAREAEVLALYASGETAERVATQLFISRETVLDHIRRIRAKYRAQGLAADSKIDLHRRALEEGIIAGRSHGSDD
jgi:DNA-binding NarL/FixJ family response regulator